MGNEIETPAAEISYGTFKPRFSKEARTHYTYPSAKMLLKNLESLSKMIQHHKDHQRPRLDILDDYYEGDNNGILQKKRRKEEHLSDHRSPHNYAEYVSQFIQGYMCGIPIKVQHEKDEVNEKLNDINEQTDGDAHNSDLILDLSIYGRAYELMYRSQTDENRFVLLSPLETFVIYDDTVEHNPIAAVRYFPDSTDPDLERVEFYTNEKIYKFKSETLELNNLDEDSIKDHYFEGVPIIEYSNNRFRQGDFEKVINLIDLYDAAQSDTANYMTDLNDAMLVIKGNLDIDFEKAKDQKNANLLFLQAEMGVDGRVGVVDAGYIYKQYDVAGVEKYKDRVSEDIHKFTNTPDMNDEKFGGNQSGEAMKYKLFGLEQKRAIKERLFKRSMRRRYQLLSNIMKTSSEGEFDLRELSITFTPNLPENVVDQMNVFLKAGGELSQETLLSLLSFVKDPQAEIKRLNEEKPGSINAYDFQKMNSENQQSLTPEEVSTDE